MAPFYLLNFVEFKQMSTEDSKLGGSLFKYDDIYKSLKGFKQKLELDMHGCTRLKLCFAKVDVKRCFELIGQEQVLEIIKDVLKGEIKDLAHINGQYFLCNFYAQKRFTFVNGPINISDQHIMKKCKKFAMLYSQGKSCHISKIGSIPEKVPHNDELFGYLESIHCTLSYKFLEVFFNVELACEMELKYKTIIYSLQILKTPRKHYHIVTRDVRKLNMTTENNKHFLLNDNRKTGASQTNI
ncbi:hypothetical protein C2G38_2141157 [Gigaspora rosea]|uniref:RNA-directed DNA polymerase n=1 Tax=Gigaspora rosea TaxID=44941 RepID=A0A397VF80_9GLOM|nr:hypothetical protein C2G38_2141157 [Gigaspora rosea]